jgi:hypothetical protein
MTTSNATATAPGHSDRHPQLDQIPAGWLREELYASKARIEDR